MQGVSSKAGNALTFYPVSYILLLDALYKSIKRMDVSTNCLSVDYNGP